MKTHLRPKIEPLLSFYVKRGARCIYEWIGME